MFELLYVCYFSRSDRRRLLTTSSFNGSTDRPSKQPTANVGLFEATVEKKLRVLFFLSSVLVTPSSRFASEDEDRKAYTTEQSEAGEPMPATGSK